MAIFAIGDIHGCFDELEQLLKVIDFTRGRDRLWFVGDLLSRGPKSMEVLNRVRGLGEDAVCVLGNHDLRAISVLAGVHPGGGGAWFEWLQNAPDRQELLQWLSGLPFMHRDDALGWSMVHAGIAPGWSLDEAMARSRAASAVLGNPEHTASVFDGQWGHLPVKEPPPSEARMRLWYDITVFTRIRVCAADGSMVWPGMLRKSGLAHPFMLPPPESPVQPWHSYRHWSPEEKMVFGHWAGAGVQLSQHAVGLDGACVYGRRLVAMRLDAPGNPLYHVPCPCYSKPEES
ncbi:MAG: symmetrical bis(5'-nucleosyl)-tetraphosphatase [Magnetococcales bacterium]|nr:symmetrical bis(5'-nucleosyl)-tetraphosphatase [Magnetococcales bacterium]